MLALRLEALTPDERTLLRCGATLGDGFRLWPLKSIARLPLRDTDVFEALSRLTDSGWLLRSGRSFRALFSFKNRLVRDLIYETISLDMRDELHDYAGEYYYTITRTGKNDRSKEAIHHYLKAGKHDHALRVIDFVIEQAGHSQTLLIEHLGEAIRIAALDPALGKQQAGYAERLGDIHAAQEDYRRAAEIYADLSPTISTVSLLGKLGLVLLPIDPLRAANMLAQIAPTIATDYPNDYRWRLEAGLAWGLALAGKQYDSVRRTRDALSTLSTLSGLGNARTLIRGMLGMILHYQGEQSEAHPHLESARAGWGAREESDGVLLINQVLIGTNRDEITRQWLKMTLKPLLTVRNE
jgi:tetratricopeptide (TPR) repeat protein